MITRQSPDVTVPDNQAVVVDRSVFRDILRRRLRQWIGLGVILYALFLCSGLFLIPQSYSATVSVSIDQSSSSTNSPLAALTGLGAAGGKKYTGVLHSRMFAQEVENQVHLADIYGIPPSKAIEKMIQGVKVDDNVLDGLMYITVTLDAPPRMVPDTAGRRVRIRQAAAQIANAYVVALRHYLKDSDTDKDAALLREADTQKALIKQGYLDKQQQLQDYIRSLGVGFAAAQDSLKAGPETPLVVSTLEGLYKDRADAMARVTEDETRREGTARMVRGDLDKLRSIPAEDPVLTDARSRYDSAVYEWENTKVRYGDDNPYVVTAYQKMKLAEKYLREQANNLLKGHNSDQVRYQADLATLTLINGQIRQAQGSLQVSREQAARLKQLESEADGAEKVWEEAQTRYAQIRLQTVSAQNRMTLVDSAMPPEHSRPGLLTMLVTSLVGAVAIVAVWMLLEYLIRSQTSLRLIQST
ncbi:MAG TPA: hypothetical protein VFA07_15635 [Chthonomonadaceae bacterium]|nr:hypothetical protein [Chthonomonadaceae bacterium]